MLLLSSLQFKKNYRYRVIGDIAYMVVLLIITRVVNIAAMNDEIVIGNEIFCSSDYRAIGFKMSIDR
jgi:hypothetical protein